MRIFVFGGSTVLGYFDTDTGGWVNQIALHYQKETLKNPEASWAQVFNLGISGDTTEGVLERFRTEYDIRNPDEDESFIVISTGLNDAALIENRVVTEVYDFQEAYEAIIDEALKLTPRVICVGLSAVNESETDPWQYSATGKQWKNNRINLFEDTIKQSAEMKEVPFVPIHDAFLERMDKKQLLADGLHPNHEGHAFIAREVLAAIEAIR